MSIVITYETLFDVLRKESSREDLQELPESFYADVQTFLDEKKTDSTGSDATSKRAGIELENVKKILRELYDRRERKLLLLALNRARTESAIIDPSILLPEERTLFDTLVDTLRTNKEKVLTPLTGSALAEAPVAPLPRPAPVNSAVEESTPKKSKTASGNTAEAGGTVLQEPEPDTTGVRVKFVKAVPKFIGRDMTIFGPFEPGAETNLPEEVANVLAKKGHIELLNTSS